MIDVVAEGIRLERPVGRLGVRRARGGIFHAPQGRRPLFGDRLLRRVKRHLGRDRAHVCQDAVGGMFWFSRNTFVGSYWFLSATSRA